MQLKSDSSRPSVRIQHNNRLQVCYAGDTIKIELPGVVNGQPVTLTVAEFEIVDVRP